MEFLNSLKNRSKFNKVPFEHWEINKPLTKDCLDEICRTEIVDLKKLSQLAKSKKIEYIPKQYVRAF